MPYVRIWVHLIWTTKNRENLISKELKSALISHLTANAKQKGIYLDTINCVENHCHAIISLGASQSISKVAFLLKGESSHWINKNKLGRGHFEWQDEYIAVSVSESQLERVRNYIRNQEAHQRKKSFNEEYEKLMNEFGTKYLG